MDKHLNVIQSIATNLAFTLPGVAGPVGAAGVVGLFGLMDLFGSSGPSEAEMIQELIQAAITELQGFMRQLKLEKAEGDAESFFEWYRQNIVGLSSDGLTQADVDDVELRLLPKLESADSFASGSLLNNLLQISNENYLRLDGERNEDFNDLQSAIADRSQDVQVSVLLLTMTALISALKLQLRLHAACAAFYAPDPFTGECETREADQSWQNHSEAWMRALEQLKALIGTEKPKAPEAKRDGFSSATTSEDEWKQIAQRASGPNFPVALAPHIYVAIRPLILEMVKQDRLPMAYIEVMDALKGDDLIWDFYQHYRALGATFAFPYYPWTDWKFDLRSAAASVGWGSGIGTFLKYRVCRRLWDVKVQAGDTKIWVLDVSDHGPEGCELLQLWDIDQRLLFDCVAYPGYLSKFDGVARSLLSGSGAGDYADDLRVVDAWRDGLINLLQQQPPTRPSNMSGVSVWGADAPPLESQWASATHVRYALSHLGSDTGPSQRSPWGAWIEVRNRWKPTIRHPQAPDGTWQIQLWRQFRFRNSIGDENELGQPRIIATLAGDTREYVDTEPARPR